MRGTVARELKKMAKVFAGDDPVLFKLYYKNAKKIHKKVLRAK